MTLAEALCRALVEAKRERDESGRGERGRMLALTVTKIEEAMLWHLAAACEMGVDEMSRRVSPTVNPDPHKDK